MCLFYSLKLTLECITSSVLNHARYRHLIQNTLLIPYNLLVFSLLLSFIIHVTIKERLLIIRVLISRLLLVRHVNEFTHVTWCAMHEMLTSGHLIAARSFLSYWFWVRDIPFMVALQCGYLVIILNSFPFFRPSEDLFTAHSLALYFAVRLWHVLWSIITYAKQKNLCYS